MHLVMLMLVCIATVRACECAITYTALGGRVAPQLKVCQAGVMNVYTTRTAQSRRFAVHSPAL